MGRRWSEVWRGYGGVNFRDFCYDDFPAAVLKETQRILWSIYAIETRDPGMRKEHNYNSL